MNAPLPACWSAEQARRVFVTEALEGGDAIFLATHTPITGFDRGGRDAGEIDGEDEHAILEALAAPDRRHAFCVVQGEPGSGKSHLIRWLSINWSAESDIKLLLRRADGSLEGALRQLKSRLPAEFGHLFDNIGQRQRAKLEGRANVFAVTLAATLEPDHFDKPIGDEKWCADLAPTDLLGSPEIRRAWDGPSRVLNLMEGAGGGRNSATAAFDLFDIERLADACDKLRPTSVSPRAEELARRLQRESEAIRAHREQEWLADELARESPQYFPTSLTLIRALNARRNEAIRNVLGVSADSLKSLFRNVREALVARGQRLVLLLEDITSWEGLDDSLLDVLVDNAEAHGGEGHAGVCPIISVVGVTPEFYGKLPGNIRQRITHEIKLGESHGGLQDVATLRDSHLRRAFVARYLAAVRVGVPALDGWREELRYAPQTPPPNACPGCPRKEECFSIFGDEDGVGLFPFTASALDRFFDALKENDHGQTWRTPRGILQAILNPNLSQPDAIEQSRFPLELIETTAIREDRRSDQALSNRLERIVHSRVADVKEQDRIRRFLAYWADPARADTTLVDSELALAGAKESLFSAFGLQWIGDPVADSMGGLGSSVQPATEPEGGLLAPEEEEADQPALTPPPPISPGRGRPQPQVRPPIIAPKPKRLQANRNHLEQYQHELRNWSKGGAIANPSTWNRILFELIQSVNPRRFGVSPSLFGRIVTAQKVKLEGSTSGSRQYLLVGADPWVRDGLEAYLSLKLERGKSLGDAAFHRRNLAVMMRRLETIAAVYVDSQLPRLQSGEDWSPIPSIAQVLVARAWLRGTLSPQASVPEHMRSILSDETEATSDPKARSLPWQDWLTATDKWHERLRGELRSMVSLSIGEGTGGAGLTDASELAGAIERIRNTGGTDPVPADDGGLPDPLASGRKLAALWREKRLLIDRTETAQLRNRTATLFALLRGRGVADHLARVDHAVTKVSNLIPTASPEIVSSWKQAHSRIKARLQDGAASKLEEFMANVDDPAEGLPEEKMSARIEWMAKAPAKDLADVLELANLGEKLIDQLYQHATDAIGDGAGAGLLGEVRRVGSGLKVASRYAEFGASR